MIRTPSFRKLKCIGSVIGVFAAIVACANPTSDRRSATSSSGTEKGSSATEKNGVSQDSTAASQPSVGFGLSVPPDVRKNLADGSIADKDADKIAGSGQGRFPGGKHKMFDVICGKDSKPGHTFGFLHLSVRPVMATAAGGAAVSSPDSTGSGSSPESTGTGSGMVTGEPAANMDMDMDAPLDMPNDPISQKWKGDDKQPALMIPLRCEGDFQVSIKGLEQGHSYNLSGRLFSVRQHQRYRGSATFTYPSQQPILLDMRPASDGRQLVKVIFGDQLHNCLPLAEPDPVVSTPTPTGRIDTDQSLLEKGGAPSSAETDDCMASDFPTGTEPPPPGDDPWHEGPNGGSGIACSFARPVSNICVDMGNGVFKQTSTEVDKNCEEIHPKNEVDMKHCQEDTSIMVCPTIAKMVCVKNHDGTFERKSAYAGGPKCEYQALENAVDDKFCSGKH